MKDLPEDFIKELSDNEQDFKLSEMFTMENIMKLVMQLLVTLPDFTLEFLSKIIGIDKEILKNELTPKELLDIVQEFWKMNELESFFDQVKPMIQKAITLIGFNEQSPSASKSE